jgi:hypothetical protein
MTRRKALPSAPKRLNSVEDAAALVRLFQALPRAQSADDEASGIPYKHLIGGIPRSPDEVADIPRQLLLMRPVSVKRPKAGGTRKGLHAVESAAGKLLKALGRLSSNQLDALVLPPMQLSQLKSLVGALGADAAMARPVKTGRPRRDTPSQAKKIAAAVAQHYHCLTGKRPTAYDDTFVELLTGVYQVLGVDARARSQAMSLYPKAANGHRNDADESEAPAATSPSPEGESASAGSGDSPDGIADRAGTSDDRP